MESVKVSLLVSFLLLGLASPAISRSLGEFNEQKTFFLYPSPHSAGTPPYSGSTPTYGSTPSSTPSYGTGGGHSTPTPSYGTGGGHSTPTPSYGTGGGHSTPTTPTYGSSGGGHSTPSTPSYGTGGGHSTPTTPTYGSSGGGHSTPSTPSYGTGGGHSTPSIPSYGHGPSTPSYGSGSGTPSTPSYGSGGGHATPTPSVPSIDPRHLFTGTCDYWRSHPQQIYAIVGYLGTIGQTFGAACGLIFGPTTSLHDALSNPRTDGYGSLIREGTASLLNSMSNSHFPFDSDQVRNAVISSISSVGAAAAQADVFHLANQGHYHV